MITIKICQQGMTFKVFSIEHENLDKELNDYVINACTLYDRRATIVTATDETLTLIRDSFRNLPIPVVGNICTWAGDDAQFVINNLRHLLFEKM